MTNILSRAATRTPFDLVELSHGSDPRHGSSVVPHRGVSQRPSGQWEGGAGLLASGHAHWLPLGTPAKRQVNRQEVR